MAIQTSEKTIDGCEVRCTPMAARPAAQMLARLMKYAGATMNELRKVDINAIGKHPILDLMSFIPAVSALLAQMSPEDFDSISCALLGRCTVIARVDGEPHKYDLSKAANIDAAFEGKLSLMIKVLAYVLEVHYAGFFLDLVFGDVATEPAEKPAE